MRHLPAFILAAILAAYCALSVCAADIRPGEVLYTADFSAYTSLRDTGVRLGTLSGPKAQMRLENGELTVTSSDGEKTYLLLPDTGLWTDSYVMEFIFRFTAIDSANGYCGLILSSRGDAPFGRTELIFRVDGTVDGYEGHCEEMKAAAGNGEPITVRVHVTYGFLVDFQLIFDGKPVRTFTPDALSRVSSGGRGFVLRNASAAFQSARVVSGAYTELENAPAAPSYIAPPEWQLPAESSPPTGDAVLLWTVPAFVCAALAARMHRRRVRKV